MTARAAVDKRMAVPDSILRAYMVGLVIAYYLFILVSYIVDRALERHCRDLAVPKNVHFVFRSYVSRKQVDAFVNAFLSTPFANPRYVRWLSIWRWLSFSFLILFIGLFVLYAISGIAHTWAL